MPEQEVSEQERRRRCIEHASANAGAETICWYSSCEGPYRNPEHHQQSCLSNPPLVCKHGITHFADMGAGHADMCNQSGPRTQGPTQLVHPAENPEVKAFLQVELITKHDHQSQRKSSTRVQSWWVRRPEIPERNRLVKRMVDLPQDGMYTSAEGLWGHNLIETDVFMSERAPSAISEGHILSTWIPKSTAIYRPTIERAPGVTSKYIDQLSVCGVPSVSFSGDCTELIPTMDMYSLMNMRI